MQIKAIKNSESALEFASYRLRSNEEFMKEAIAINKDYFTYATS